MYPGAGAAAHPDKPAIIHVNTGEKLTYAELEAASASLARHLREAGLERGANVAFFSDNCPQVFEVYWAGLRSGFYVTGVNYHLTVDEAAYILEDCGAEALVLAGRFAEIGAELAERLPQLKVRLAFDGPVPGFDDYEEVIASTSSEPFEDQPRGIDMLYSSGTTGRPKGIKAPLPDRQVGDPGDPFTAIFGGMYGFDGDTVYFSCAPTYHAAPLRFGGIVNALGGTVVMGQGFDPEKSLEIIERYRVTHSQWVPTMFVRMLKLHQEARDRYDVSSQKIAVHAAAPCPVDVKQQMMAWWGPILHEYYASTEANGITFIGPEQWLEKPGSVGKAGLGIIRVCGPDGAELPVGETGTVYFERETTPFVYHNDPEKSLSAQHPDHPTWTTTGDIGHVDEDGFLFLTDRAAFTIIAGGVNIYPQEIENALTLHPAILDVAVIGIPHDELGQAVHAVVQLVPGRVPNEDLGAEILASLEGVVARYKVPRSIEFVDALPRTATGKLVKRELTARYAPAV